MSTDIPLSGGGPAPFTPEIASARTMQAQEMAADDTPVDTNLNAALARVQAETLAVFGRVTAMNADRREKLADVGAGIFRVGP